MLGLPYERPAHLVRNYLEVLNAAFAGPGPVDVENDDYRVHNPLDVTDIVPTPILLAALAPVMLRIAGEHASGTILWMADERAIGEHVVPPHHEGRRRRGPTGAAGRRRRSGRAVRQRRGRRGACARANRVLGHAEYSPNYQRLLEHGDATDVGDLLAAGGRVGRRRPVAQLPRRRGHRPVGARAAVRARSRRPHRVAGPDARVPRVVMRRALTFRTRARARRRTTPSGPVRSASLDTSPDRPGEEARLRSWTGPGRRRARH